jgi:uncharacterized protein (TIGR02001 family)
MEITMLNRFAHPFFPVIAVAALMAPVTSAFAQQNALPVVKEYMAAWNEHNPNKAASYFDLEEVIYFDASVGTPQQGAVVARDNVIKPFMTAFPDLKWEMVGEPVVSGDQVAFRWVFTGTNTGVFNAAVKPVGKKLELHGSSIIKVKDGKIIYQGDFYDALSLNKQLEIPSETGPAVEPSVHALSGYVNVLSNYQFRGLSQTWGGPAIQGGLDYTNKNGLYAGLFGSNTSADFYPGANMEIDVYGGYRGNLEFIDPHLNFDAGLLAYMWPHGNYDKAYYGGGNQSFNTVEAAFSLNYDWLTVKYSHALTDFAGFNEHSFGPTFTGSSKGSHYFEANVAYEIAPKTMLNVHLGRQIFKGQNAGMNYNDYKLGVARTFGDKDVWNGSVAIAGATGSQFWKAYASSANPGVKDVGKAALVLQVGRTF